MCHMDWSPLEELHLKYSFMHRFAPVAAVLALLASTATHADPGPNRSRCVRLQQMSYVQLDSGLYKTVPVTDAHGKLIKMHSAFLVNTCSETIDVAYCIKAGGQCLSGFSHAVLGPAGAGNDLLDTGTSTERAGGDVDADFFACGLGQSPFVRGTAAGCGKQGNLATVNTLPRSSYKGLALDK